MINANAQCIEGSGLSFHECRDAFQATDEEKVKINHFIEKGTTAELIVGDKRIVRVSRSSFVVIEWGYVNDPLVSYAFRWRDYPAIK